MAKRRQNGEGTIYQRSDGLWVCDITLGYDENNKRIRKTLSSKNLETLKKKINETKYLKDRDMVAAPNDITVEEWMEFWLKTYKKPFIKPTTYDTYYSAIHNYIIPRFGSTKLTALITSEVQQFINNLSEHGKKSSNGLAPSSIRKIYITLQQGYEQAIAQGILYKNPCKGIKTPKQEKSPAIAFTSDEQNKFLKACDNTSTYNNLFIFGFNTGLRLGEMLGLTWDDIDWNDKTIQISKSIVETANHDENAIRKIQTVVSTPKTESSKRVVPLTKQAITALECQKSISNSVFVFSSAAGTPLTRRNILRSFSSTLKKAKITSPVTPHSMRHSFATRLLEKGADIKTISELLGHKSIQITLDIYSHISVDKKRNAIELLN